MKPATLRKSTTLVSVLSVLPHIFCCGIPVAAALISLGTTAGLAGALAANPLYRLVDAYHTKLLALAIICVAVSGLLNFIAYRIDCHTAASHCAHGDCTPRKRTGLKIFLFSCALLALDLSWFATEKYALHLHQPAPVAQPSSSQA